ncbi:FKBP-type peptidyl-prolyl cis-trans isomerase [Hymenobacter sp. NST-14]|uniref:FKBP-type peptidyl-prolyl cis-trans isomerase n=1 Tax=Hymenobacter piscis TaxID=2839984 RepID=UPI001C038161|nr:FKBP-type peptidyl-prolyl cis-trans isomerase [Hymenobacter piscis]MBT9393515.1 FKBP-type peptidyl-prolyl cis-trans isomerase [Hymenobacter piscis]
MKKFPLILSLLALALSTTPALTSCNKEPSYVKQQREFDDAQKTLDDTAIKAYLTRHGISNAERLESGIYLVPVTEGPTGNPLIQPGQTVTVNYVGRFISEALDGQVFDASSNNRTACGCLAFVNGPTSGLITGWSTATLQMRKGDRKLVLIPSYLAYKAQGSGSIPPNTPLLFDMEILDVQ